MPTVDYERHHQRRRRDDPVTVAIGGPVNGELISIEDFQSFAEDALLSGANDGISVMVEEWDGPVSTPGSREKACDDYVRSRTQEELREADLRSYARQIGLSYEGVLWRSGWHDSFDRQVIGRIDREYPGTYVQHAYGTADGNKRSARIGFYGEIHEGIHIILSKVSFPLSIAACLGHCTALQNWLAFHSRSGFLVVKQTRTSSIAYS